MTDATSTPPDEGPNRRAGLVVVPVAAGPFVPILVVVLLVLLRDDGGSSGGTSPATRSASTTILGV